MSGRACGDDPSAFDRDLRTLARTRDHAERDRVALRLAATGDPRLRDVLVELIQRPELEGHRGTLVHCLSHVDCAGIAGFLRELVRAGNFEVADQARLILEEQALAGESGAQTHAGPADYGGR